MSFLSYLLTKPLSFKTENKSDELRGSKKDFNENVKEKI